MRRARTAPMPGRATRSSRAARLRSSRWPKRSPAASGWPGAGLADLAPDQLRRLPLGAGAELVVMLAAGAPAELAAAIERAARELRACLRYHEEEGVPSVQLVGRVPRSRAVLVRKMTQLLEAL